MTLVGSSSLMTLSDFNKVTGKNLKSLEVGGGLDLSDCTSLTRLPEGLRVGGGLDLNGCTSLIRWLIKERRYEWLKERVKGQIRGL